MRKLVKNEIILTETRNIRYTEASYKISRRKHRIGAAVFAPLDRVPAGLCLVFCRWIALGWRCWP